jgi:hypothetical protein
MVHLQLEFTRLAVDQLIEKIKGGETSVAKTIMFEPIMVIRKTCGYRKSDPTKKHSAGMGRKNG